jgi:putative ABC transport system ATP-binding protein
MAATQKLIELQNVSRTFDDGSVQALRGIDLAIMPGEFVAIVGPSGCGKSSLVHVMAGFDLPTSGRVLWKGVEMRGQRKWVDLRRKEIGIVFQEFLLLPTLSALENVEIAMSGTWLGATAQRSRAAKLLDQVGLSARANHLPYALSGGERQRVAIARSIANRPQLLLCDEPTGNLDSENARGVIDLLLSIRAADGMALVLVTHDRDLAALGDRRIQLIDGRVAVPAAGNAAA